jgi:hypothetical protein
MTAASISPSRTPHRAGFGHALWAARIFFDGPAWGDILVRLLPGLALLLAGVWVVKIDPDAKDGFAFRTLMGAMLLPLPGVLTLRLEAGRTRALAFLDLLPQSARPLQLVLWPMRLFGIVAAALFTVIGHYPPLAVVIFVGSIWWSISVGHWCAGRGGWGLALVFLLVYIHAFVLVATISEAPSLRGAAAYASGPALFALLVPYRNKVGRLLASTAPRTRAKPMPDASIQPGALTSLARPRPRRGTLYRAARLAASGVPGPRWIAPVVVVISTIMVGVGLMRSAVAELQWFLIAMTASGALARSSDKATVDFLITRPLSRVRLCAATVLPWIGLALVPLAEQCLFIKVFLASRPSYPLDRTMWWFLEKGIGISPQHLIRTDHGTSIAMTADVLSLLYRDAFRMGFLALAVLFSMSLLSVAARATPRLRWIARFLCLTVGAAGVIPCYLVLFRWPGWSLPPLWLSATLAAVSASIFVRQVFGRAAG